MKKEKNFSYSDENRLYSDRSADLAKNIDKILGALGLAMRAGGLAVGTEAVSLAVSKEKARIVFMTDDIARNSKDKLMSKLYAFGTKYIILPCSMADLAQKLGKTGLISSAALVRPGFEKIIFKCMDSSNTVTPNENTTEVQ